MKHTPLLLLLLLCLGLLHAVGAQKPQELLVHSAAMEKDIPTLIMLPEDYDGERAYPVIYLLHGWEMPFTDWLRVQRELPELATRHGVILVCPESGNSWYWDSPVNPRMRYETYVAHELTDYIKTHYKTIDDRRARAITGLSMGGHGALWLAIRHQDIFSACGAMSGAVDIRPFPNKWNMADSLGKYEENPERWAAHTVMTQLDKLSPGELAIIIDCGTEDFFHEVNEKLHCALLERKIPHDYISRPGAHNGRYWRNAILYQLLYFAEHFKHMQQQESK